MSDQLMATRRARRVARLLAIGALAVTLGGCTLGFHLTNMMPVAETYETEPVSLDTSSALSIVNGFRSQRGLPSVRVDGALMQAARNHAKAMAAADRMRHSLGPGDNLRTRIRAVGYRAQLAAENIGVRYRNISDAMDAWMASSGHRRNLLNPQVTEIGVAAARAPDSQNGVFWVIVLARPRA